LAGELDLRVFLGHADRAVTTSAPLPVANAAVPLVISMNIIPAPLAGQVVVPDQFVIQTKPPSEPPSGA